MEIIPADLSFYVEMLRENKPFSFVRYGNGEWECILELYHATRSGSQRFTPGLKEALELSILESRGENFLRALQSITYLQRLGIAPQAEMWLQVNSGPLSWFDGEVFHKASSKGRLSPLITELRKRKLVLVGPKWLRKIQLGDSEVEFVTIRSKDCWQDYSQLFEHLSSYKDYVISFSAGPTAKVLIHNLFPVIGGSCWLIDFGSMWDPYGGVKSRKYHSRVNRKVISINLKV